MSSPYENALAHPLRAVFGPFAWPRTYTNLLYLMLGFPLGLAYFVFYVTGLALGIGLAILAIGVAILAVVILAAIPFILVERGLAVHLLGEPVPPTGFRGPDDLGFWPWLKATGSNPVLWKGLLFLVLKFPLGLASWIFAIVAIAVSFGFLFAPAVFALGGDIQIGVWEPATIGEAFALVPIGFLMLLVSLHLLNGLAWLWAKFASVMLGRGAKEPSAPHTGDERLAPVLA